MASQIGIWSYGAQVSQPIFTGGALRGNLRLAKSENQQALIAYRQTIQRAFGDVSDALIGNKLSHAITNKAGDTVFEPTLQYVYATNRGRAEVTVARTIRIASCEFTTREVAVKFF